MTIRGDISISMINLPTPTEVFLSKTPSTSMGHSNGNLRRFSLASMKDGPWTWRYQINRRDRESLGPCSSGEGAKGVGCIERMVDKNEGRRSVMM